LNNEAATKRQFNGKPDTERSRSVLINRYLHPSTPLRIQLIGLFGVGSTFHPKNESYVDDRDWGVNVQTECAVEVDVFIGQGGL
jgi:hypothetical protein